MLVITVSVIVIWPFFVFKGGFHLYKNLYLLIHLNILYLDLQTLKKFAIICSVIIKCFKDSAAFYMQQCNISL